MSKQVKLTALLEKHREVSLPITEQEYGTRPVNVPEFRRELVIPQYWVVGYEHAARNSLRGTLRYGEFLRCFYLSPSLSLSSSLSIDLFLFRLLFSLDFLGEMNNQAWLGQGCLLSFPSLFLISTYLSIYFMHTYSIYLSTSHSLKCSLLSPHSFERYLKSGIHLQYAKSA